MGGNQSEQLSRRPFWSVPATVFAVIVLVAASVALFSSLRPTSSSAASPPSASLDQCTNGAVGPPLSPQPCVGSNAASVTVAIPGINGGAGTAYRNWVNGNSNGTKSHWREGDFISYRATVSGIQTGTPHVLEFHYDTVNSGLHAIDYVGSYDATESTGTAATTLGGAVIQANNASPCADLVLAGTFPWACTPSSPQGSLVVPPVHFTGPDGQQNCGGAPGTFTGAQETGGIKLYGPAGSTIDSITYPSQDVVSGTGTCTTFVDVTFTVSENISSTQPIVIAWGGHIANERDWGAGNAASTISGSPFHMSLQSLDGVTTGSQDRALQSSAIYFTPTLATQVMANGSPVTGTLALASSVNDTATLSGALSTATGTVTYSRYPNLTCSGTPVTEQVAVAGAVVPPSSSFVPTAGGYSYRAAYGGDAKDLAATSPCEPFAVGKGSMAIATTVFDASTNLALASPVPLNATVYDTTALSHAAGPVATGTVTYTFYGSGDCLTGTVVGTPQVVTLNAGTVPNSSNEGPLTAAGGPYAFAASYSGDANYLSGTSDCEPFAVAKDIPSIATTVFSAATNQALTSPVPLNATVYDTATLSHAAGPVATGTVTYTFYRSGDCLTGTVVGTPQVVTLNAGTVPNSSNEGPLTAAVGPYAFRAVYSGDSNYTEGASECEPFSVEQGATSIATVVHDAATTQAIADPLPLAGTAYDTATLSHTAGPAPTGTVTYTFYRAGDCTAGTVVGTPQVVTLNPDGTVPPSSNEGPLTAAGGPYAFAAAYSGDGNYFGSTSDCEPFSVEQGVVSSATTVHDATTGQPIAGTIPLAATVYDTTALSHAAGPAPTGTVTYTFYRAGDCTTGTVVGTPQVVTLNPDGTVPPSSSEGPLTASGGPYAFAASYSGDGNYIGATSPCEPFSVDPGTTTIATTILDAATGLPIAGTIPFATTVYDTTALSHAAGPAPTGTVTYTFYRAGDCTTGTVVGTRQVVTLNPDGTVPPSSNQGPLTASGGPYAFAAAYSGDGDHVGATSPCEPFSVARRAPTITTLLPVATTIVGTPVHDTAALQGASAGAGGTVTYTVYGDSACASTVKVAGTVTVAASRVPDSGQVSFSTPGTYYFQASYSGDGDNVPALSSCVSEVLIVTPVPIGPPQTGLAAILGHPAARLLGVLLLVGAAIALGLGALLRRRSALR